MIKNAMDILNEHPVRKNKKQKERFRANIMCYCQSLGYPVSVEKGSLGSRNIVIGDPQSAKYLVTAHYDTPAAMLLPNFLTPCNPITFILYQLILVSFFLGAAFSIGWAAGLIFHDVDIGYMIGWISYWVLLLLMMFGPANRNNANDNTSGVVAVLDIAEKLSHSQSHQVCFVLFDLEEAGLVGSSSYRKKHKEETEKQLVLNMDCIGDGDDILLFPSKRVKQDGDLIARLRSVSGIYHGKRITVREKGFSVYPSDQKNFPLGVGIAAFRRSPWLGLYCGRIHTARDMILEKENINTLRDCLLRLTDTSV